MNNLRSKIRQYRYECDVWKRNLEFLMMENIHLKNRLAAVLKNGSTDSNFMNVAEQYQNYFTTEDETIHSLRKDIAQLDEQLLQEEKLENEKKTKAVLDKQKQMSTEIENTVTEFNKVKFEFNNYLDEVL